MALVKMKEILNPAENHNYGVGAFSVANMEMVMAAVQAANNYNPRLSCRLRKYGSTIHRFI
jgi:fructose-bisphosphate aldolase, class II